MAVTDGLFRLQDLPRAMVLLTRLPVPGADGDRAGASAWAWPLVGFAVGGLAGGLAWLALGLGLPDAAAAGLAIGAVIVMTGGLHEDGLADCADGFWGGDTVARRLEIMKDSRIGSYGVLALILMVGLKWVLVTALIGDGALWAAVLAPTMLSRAAMAGVMAGMPFARDTGFARHVGRPRRAAALAAVGLATIAAAALIGPGAIWALIGVSLTAFAVARLAHAKIGGQTGDVLGAAQTSSEVAALMVLAVVL